MWLSDGRNERVRTNVSNKLRACLELDPTSVTVYYKEHIKSIKVSFDTTHFYRTETQHLDEMIKLTVNLHLLTGWIDHEER